MSDRRNRPPNRWGCKPADDVCVAHDQPLLCGHGCVDVREHHCRSRPAIFEETPPGWRQGSRAGCRQYPSAAAHCPCGKYIGRHPGTGCKAEDLAALIPKFRLVVDAAVAAFQGMACEVEDHGQMCDGCILGSYLRDIGALPAIECMHPRAIAHESCADTERCACQCRRCQLVKELPPTDRPGS